MANNLQVKDANSNTVTIQSTDVGGGTQLPNSKINDGVNDVKTASAANLAGQSGINAAMVTGPGEWTATNAPAVGNLASASKAAGAAGVRHVCRELSGSWSSDGTANGGAQQVTLVVRDGASGAGTILAQWNLGLLTTTPADAVNRGTFSLTGLNLIGSAATAMTVEFTGTAGTHELYTANVGGYDVS